VAANQGTLYYGDNLDVLKRHVKDESVDLVYLDPPFNSNASYNVLFKEADHTPAHAQIEAFGDTWRWDSAAAHDYQMVVEKAGGRVSDAMRAFRTFLGESDVLAYLSMMAPRLVELRRVLKPTGSIYLHCDPTASHYLKMLMDAVFGPEQFRNDIVWKRKTGRGETNRAAVRFGVAQDNILFYARSSKAKLHRQYKENDPEYIERMWRHVDADGRRYRIDNLASPSYRPNLVYEYKGYPPPAKGWAVSRERMAQMDAEGRLYFPKSKTGRIQRKRFLDEHPGHTVDSVWDDVGPISSQAAERLGYPTQKPELLLERIISASSEPDDLVLDPFCGCGTTIAAAQKLGRRWIGIDITHLSVGLIKHRLNAAFNLVAGQDYDVVGEPTDLAGARELASEDKFQFQAWALGLVGARTDDSAKKGADKGIDGRLLFHDEGGSAAKTKQIILSVKGGHTGAQDVRDLVGVVQRESAQIGVLISMQKPTQPMRAEAASHGFYRSPGFHRDYQRIQLISVEEALDGTQIDYPHGTSTTFAVAPKADEEDLGPPQEEQLFEVE
jgi:site-specific DNA-methyltransferase (adenine-specific)